MFSGFLQKDLKVKLDGGKCFQTCHTRFAVFCPLPSSGVSSLYYWKRNFCFFVFQKKNMRSVFESFSPVHTKTLKRWKCESIPYGAYVTVVVYYVWHRRMWKPRTVFVRPHGNEKRAFSKSPLGRAFFEKLRIRWPFSPDKCGRLRPNQRLKSPFSKKYSDTCGRDLSPFSLLCKSLEYILWNPSYY